MTQNFFFDKFFREIANVFIEYFVVVTPIYSLIIIFITARMYHTERVNTSSTDKKSTNIFFPSYSFIVALPIAAYARFNEKVFTNPKLPISTSRFRKYIGNFIYFIIKKNG